MRRRLRDGRADYPRTGTAKPRANGLAASFLPSSASVGNPVDMIASAPPEHYRQRPSRRCQFPSEVDALIVIYIPIGMGDPVAYSAAIRDGVRGRRSICTERRTNRSSAAGCPTCRMTLPRERDQGQDNAAGLRLSSKLWPAIVLGSGCVQYADSARNKPHGHGLPEFDDIDPQTARSISPPANCTQAIWPWLAVGRRSARSTAGHETPRPRGRHRLHGRRGG